MRRADRPCPASERGIVRAHRVAAGLVATLAMVALLAGCSAGSGSPEGKQLILLSTTTTRDSGVLDALVADFEHRTGYQVKPIVAGSGEVLALAARGEGDVLLTHSPEAEEEFMAAGHGVRRELVMHNDFVIVGPHKDPARIAGLPVTQALERIADTRSPFVSRGDESGTNVKELELWKAAGRDPVGQSWYVETGSGQGQALNVASETGGYALADRGTYLALRDSLALDILVERNSPDLLNIYHVITVNPDESSRIKRAGADAFADYVTSTDGQQVIASIGVEKFGEPLFVPDAGKTLAELREELRD